jgi:hypothetical protein
MTSKKYIHYDDTKFVVCIFMLTFVLNLYIVSNMTVTKLKQKFA